MPETVPRWLLAGAGIVALITIGVGVKDFAEQKSYVSPQSATSSATAVKSDPKSPPKTTANTRRSRTSATSGIDSAVERDPAGDLEKSPITRAILQAGARAPLGADEGEKTGQAEPVENHTKAASPKCSPLPNSTKPEDVDAPYYKNWAREYGCILD
jgi:hypothetical protein